MGQRLFLVLRSALYITAFALFWLWLMPGWLNLHTSISLPSKAPVRWLGVIPLLVGLPLVFNCFARFVFAGRGTPAPFDPPRLLVIAGPYRYMRNPMYLGAGLVLAGSAILFAEFSTGLAAYAIGTIVAVNFFIMFYEEPILQQKFGDQYENYCKNVGRWIPRATAWSPNEKQAAAGGCS